MLKLTAIKFINENNILIFNFKDFLQIKYFFHSAIFFYFLIMKNKLKLGL